MAKLHDDLKRLDACKEAQEWAKDYGTLEAAWAACERGDWMLWLIGETDTSKAWSEERKPLVMCACEIARTTLPYTTDPRVKTCIEIMEAWCSGEATQEQARSAAESAAWSAARSAARSAAWSAAWSAARSAAWSAARSAARSAAWSAARSAAWSAARSAAWSAARSAAEKQSACIVRKHYPKPPKI